MLYKRKIVDEILTYVHTPDVIVLHGARQVGKTSILFYLRDVLKAQGETVHYIDLEDSRYVGIIDAGMDSFNRHLREEGLLNKAQRQQVFVFIDEIQYLANPSSFLKLAADHHRGIKLIVSGSSSFAIREKFRDSLAGRTVDFEIFNLSFDEFLMFRGYPLGSGEVHTEKKTDELKALFRQYALHGGYPRVALTAELQKKERYLQQIIDTYVKRDIRDLAAVKDVHKFNKLLEVLASQSGAMLNITELAATSRIARQTIERYLFIMENTYIIKLVKPYSRNIRSELFKMPKIYFYDTGIMQMLWLKGLQKEVIGSVFETAVFAELVKKYGQNAVLYWRTKSGREIDFIVRDRNRLIPVDAKINFDKFKPGSVACFTRQYAAEDYRVAGLTGRLKNKAFVYPWEL